MAGRLLFVASAALLACVSGREAGQQAGQDEVEASVPAPADAALAQQDGAAQPPPEDASAPVVDPVFVDVAAAAGLEYVQAPAGTTLGCDDYRPEKCPFTELHMSGGAATGDFDGDGLPDLYVTRVEEPGILFRNRGDGSFEDVTALAGLQRGSDRTPAENGAAFGDVDNDGDMDLYVTDLLATRYRLYINDGGRFTEQAVQRGAAIETGVRHRGFSVAFGDYDRDGFLDLHTTEWFQTADDDEWPNHARLLRNRGATAPGHFEDVTGSAGVDLLEGTRGTRTSFASSFTDLDGDGLPELAVVADFRSSRLYWNNGDGSFVDGTYAASVGTELNGMGSAFGDYDGDGDLDWFVTAIYDPEDRCADVDHCGWGTTGNRLYQNQGNRRFRDQTDAAGVRDGGWGWAAAFLDYDNDGDLDLTMTNGVDFPGEEPAPFRVDLMRLWRNDGSGRFEDVAAQVGLAVQDDGRGLLHFDYDADGDLDLFVANHEGRPRLFRNEGGNQNAWLRVSLRGSVSNSHGVGAKVWLTRSSGERPLLRELRAGSHFLGQSELVAHFGLGAWRGKIFELRVEWPSGRQTLLHDVPVRQAIVVRE